MKIKSHFKIFKEFHKKVVFLISLMMFFQFATQLYLSMMMISYSTIIMYVIVLALALPLIEMIQILPHYVRFGASRKDFIKGTILFNGFYTLLASLLITLVTKLYGMNHMTYLGNQIRVTTIFELFITTLFNIVLIYSFSSTTLFFVSYFYNKGYKWGMVLLLFIITIFLIILSFSVFYVSEDLFNTQNLIVNYGLVLLIIIVAVTNLTYKQVKNIDIK